MRLLRQKVLAGEMTEKEAMGMLQGRSPFQAQGKLPAMWPTPVSSDHLAGQAENLEVWEKRAAEKKEDGISLQFALRHAVQKWPTPRSSSGMNDTVDASLRRMQKVGYEAKLEQAVALESTDGGTLNPTWVEWLMGFPIGHTVLEHWETRSSRKSRK